MKTVIDILGIIYNLIITIFCLYAAWHGIKVNIKSGNIDFDIEVNPGKRLFKKYK